MARNGLNELRAMIFGVPFVKPFHMAFRVYQMWIIKVTTFLYIFSLSCKIPSNKILFLQIFEQDLSKASRNFSSSSCLKLNADLAQESILFKHTGKLPNLHFAKRLRVLSYGIVLITRLKILCVYRSILWMLVSYNVV